jgi:hypothetical protein
MPGIDDRWIRGELVPGIALAFNSTVEIVAGDHAGESGWLVAVEPGPDPIYTVELESGGGDVEVPQSLLRPA